MTRVLAALMLSLSDSFLQIHIVLHQISKPQQHNNRWLRCWHKVQPLWIIGVLKLLRAQPSPAQLSPVTLKSNSNSGKWKMKHARLGRAPVFCVPSSSSILTSTRLGPVIVSGVVVLYNCISATVINSFLMFAPWTASHQQQFFMLDQNLSESIFSSWKPWFCNC